MDSAAGAPSTLEELLGIQGETRELLNLLRKRLSPVSNPSPSEATDKVAAEKGHIQTALGNQYELNRSIRNIIDELAI